jgi:glycosyltransferase involved in cell wall biosynthesis
LSFINTSNVLTIMAGIGLDTRIVVSERVHPGVDPMLPMVWRILRTLFYRRADEIVSQTADAAAWVELNCRKTAIVIPNPLRRLPDPESNRSPLILGVGRLAKQKGFDVLLKAFAQVAFDFVDWRIAIIGIGPEYEHLSQLRDNLSLSDRVDFIGQVRDVESWMARAGLVVQPSRFEGYPNVVLESMGMGAAVVCTDCRSGPSDLIRDGVNGCLVRVDDVDALARAMAELMADQSRRRSLGRAAIRVRETHRQDRIMARWEECLLPGLANARAKSRAE